MRAIIIINIIIHILIIVQLSGPINIISIKKSLHDSNPESNVIKRNLSLLITLIYMYFNIEVIYLHDCYYLIGNDSTIPQTVLEILTNM